MIEQYILPLNPGDDFEVEISVYGDSDEKIIVLEIYGDDRAMLSAKQARALAGNLNMMADFIENKNAHPNP